MASKPFPENQVQGCGSLQSALGSFYPWGPGSQNWPTSQSPNSVGPRAAGRARAGVQAT